MLFKMVSDIIDRTSRIDTTYLWDYHTVDKHKVVQKIARNIWTWSGLHPDDISKEGNDHLIQHGHKEYRQGGQVRHLSQPQDGLHEYLFLVKKISFENPSRWTSCRAGGNGILDRWGQKRARGEEFFFLFLNQIISLLFFSWMLQWCTTQRR